MSDLKTLWKKGWLLCLAGGLGIFLLLFGADLFPNKTESVSEPSDADLTAYRENLQEEIKALCEGVEGVGRAVVAVSLDGGFSAVYATESTSSGETYVKIGSGSSASALKLYEKSPEILGIGVVCTGGGSSFVEAELTALLSATYRVPANRIHISPAK